MTTLYTGSTTHRRFAPVSHRFRFDLSMILLDADLVGGESPVLEVGNGMSVHRRDLFDGDSGTRLGDAVRDHIGVQTGHPARGRVKTLTIPRSGGYVFTPLTVHWLLGNPDGSPEVIVLEVTNTPWKERHWYVIDAREADSNSRSAIVGVRDEIGTTTATFRKELHVSPFGSMDETYELTATRPGDAISVVLRDLDSDGRPVLLARLDLVASTSLPRPRPLATRRVWMAIHWQALRLLGKRTPIHRHPDRSSSTPTTK